MSKIKLMYQRSSCGVEWADITFDFYSRYSGVDGYSYRILYPSDAYEALQTEVTRLQREVVNRNQRALDGDKAVKTQDALLAELEAIKAESAAQVKRIAELEKFAINTISDHAGVSINEAKEILKTSLSKNGE